MASGSSLPRRISSILRRLTRSTSAGSKTGVRSTSASSSIPTARSGASTESDAVPDWRPMPVSSAGPEGLQPDG